MLPLPKQVSDLLRAGMPMAAELPPSRLGRKCWVQVTPILDAHRRRNSLAVFEPGDLDYRVRWAEIEESFDASAYDLHEEYIYDRLNRVVRGESLLAATLAACGVGANELVEAWRCDCPF